MMSLALSAEVLIYVGSIVLAGFGMYCWMKIKGEYDKGGECLSPKAVSAIWITDTLFFVMVVSSSILSVWRLSFGGVALIFFGLVLFVCGIILMLAAMAKFRSFKKISGMDNSSGMVVDGIYALSRNPQYVGWFLWFLGISLIGRSGFALIITIVFMMGMHFYTVLVEEPHLDKVFGEKYKSYRQKTPRYFGFSKNPA